jgi:hypothetical protein
MSTEWSLVSRILGARETSSMTWERRGEGYMLVLPPGHT